MTNMVNKFDISVKRDWPVLGASALFFIASTATTISICRSMSGGMAMPGGWTMSMAWMRMQDQNWPAAVFAFVGMWFVMMAAMMLPAVPTNFVNSIVTPFLEASSTLCNWVAPTVKKTVPRTISITSPRRVARAASGVFMPFI